MCTLHLLFVPIWVDSWPAKFWGSCTTSRFSIDFLFLPEKPAIRCWANSILKSTSEPFLWIPPLRFITEYYESIHHCTVQNKMKNVYHAFLLSRPTEYFIWSWSCLSTLFIYLLYSLAAWGWVRLSTLRPCCLVTGTCRRGSLRVLRKATGFLSCQTEAVKFPFCLSDFLLSAI